MTVVAALRTRRFRSAFTVSAVLIVLIVLLFLLSLTTGLSPHAALATLTGSGESGDRFIVLRLRLPRATLAVLVGVAFALAGALFQSILDNPLASPDILGVTGGASAAAVTAVLVLGLSGPAVGLAAAMGAFAVAGVIYALSWQSGLLGYRFVLIGVAVAFFVEGVLGYLLTRADVRDAQSALVWLVGSLSGAQWQDAVPVAVWLAVLLPCLALLAPRLRVLQLGHDSAAGLGVRVTSTRTLGLGLAVALAAIGTAVAGPIAFVAFVSAPVARQLVRDGLALVPSAAVGAVVVLGSDFIAQYLLPGGLQVPVGIITGAVGAPYLLWLLARAQRKGSFS